MSDEKVEPGERLITSGGDRIYPKGYAVGTVISVDAGTRRYLSIPGHQGLAADSEPVVRGCDLTKMAEDNQAARAPHAHARRGHPL